MTNTNSYAQEAFEKKLKLADDVEHDFYGLLKTYFPLPNFEKITLNKMANKYGREQLWDILPLIVEDYDDQDQQEDDGGQDMPEDNLMDEQPFEDEQPQPDPELLAQEEKFKNLCNLAGAYTASVTISICNISGFITQDAPKNNFISVLYLASRAQMNANDAITALFPQMNFVNAAVYATRSNQNLMAVDDAITQLCDATPASKMALSPLKQTIQKALDATRKLADEATKMGNNPNFSF